LKVSYSKLSTFKECPFKYKCLYIDGLWHLRKDRPPLALGSSLHMVLKEFFETKKKDKRTLENLHLLLDKNWISKGFEDAEEEQKFKQKGKDMLTRFYRTYDPYLIPYFTEKTLEAKIGDLILSGRIDRVDMLDDGFELIDYKSGRVMDEEEQDLQSTLYYVLLRNSYLRITPKRLTYHYLESNQRLTMGKGEAEIESEWTKIRGIVNEIRSVGSFNPSPNKFCNWCDFKELCPEQRNSGSDGEEVLDYEDPLLRDLWM
jgi:RecB family exonuclease